MSYNLIVIKTADGAEIRFRKTDEMNFTTVELAKANVDALIDSMLALASESKTA